MDHGMVHKGMHVARQNFYGVDLTKKVKHKGPPLSFSAFDRLWGGGRAPIAPS